MERIGFVGLGLMGHGMAKNLVEKGYPLTVIAHRKREAVEDLVARGATEAKSLDELAGASDVVVICVTGSPQVEETVAGLKGRLASGALVIDASTADPTSTAKLHAELQAIGVTLVDAPLARTPNEAWEGKLDTMVGCDPETFARVKPIVSTYASNVVHVGPFGAGHTLKLVNNFVAQGYGALYSEALAVAIKSGIAPKTFDAWMRGTRMMNGYYDTFMRSAIDGETEAFRFTARNALKDCLYLESLENGLAMSNPLSNAVKNMFAHAVSQGRGDEYVPVIAELVAKANGVTIEKA
ncbi:NAD(P)-dependent oxidoreductase [Methylopila sp. Yamaguchi]|uniref:NAD(P)-dependent oxidoreductase n=1 Tax=Methylopila sp. Yamaguchi TaxID=1437817 RepID=UPI000CA65D81|nr:NAD(P)-dependent oxidoreductase [Methylopila sp. Yamaguchi]GBD47173.1 3-hydroxyisobutyrate dehydrogenase [Methylopila sp. Yamaguchi]